MSTATVTPHQDVLHVARAFSAEPTLSIMLGDSRTVQELPLAEAVVLDHEPHLLWIMDPSPNDLKALRLKFPTTSLLVTIGNHSEPRFTAPELLKAGADLVLRDDSVSCAAAGLEALARRPRR